MAKSIRSKHRRRMRSAKRQKNAPKELAKLTATLLKDTVNNPDSQLAAIVTVKTAEELKNQPSTSSSTEDGKMELDSTSADFDKKKKTNEHGQYLPWMNQRAIRKQQIKNKKVKTKKGKKISAW